LHPPYSLTGGFHPPYSLTGGFHPPYSLSGAPQSLPGGREYTTVRAPRPCGGAACGRHWRAERNDRMSEIVDKPLAIFLIIAVPLLWGLGVEIVFELLRRRKLSPTEPEDPTA